MSYILQKPISEEFHSNILNETKIARDLLPSYCIFHSDRMLAIYLDDDELSWVIDFETGNYLMDVMTNGREESHLSKFLFCYEKQFYFFFLKRASKNNMFFYIETPPPTENFEVFQKELFKSFIQLKRTEWDSSDEDSCPENMQLAIQSELSEEF